MWDVTVFAFETPPLHRAPPSTIKPTSVHNTHPQSLRSRPDNAAQKLGSGPLLVGSWPTTPTDNRPIGLIFFLGPQSVPSRF